MFYSEVDRWYYSNPVTVIDGSQDLHCGFDIDTEYTQGLTRKEGKINITVQVKGLSDDVGKVYSHPDLLIPRERKGYYWDGKPKHPVFKDWVIAEYLNDKGYDCTLKHFSDVREIRHKQSKKIQLPVITIDVYGYFLLVDYLGMVTGIYKEDLYNLSIESGKENSKRGITMERRCRTFSKIRDKEVDWVELPWLLTINNFPYKVRLRIFDLNGLHGNAGYKDVAYNVGFSLPDKELVEKYEKSDMLKVYLEDTPRFVKYSLGDLHCRELLIMNDDTFTNIYNTLGFEPIKNVTALTIGRTVANLIESCIYSCGVTPLLFKDLCRYSNADFLKRIGDKTSVYLQKVDGGRCFNNRATTTTDKCTPKTFRFMDIDMSGAYSQPQVRYPYPIGKPVILDYPLESLSKNSYLTLRQFLKEYGDELVPGLWFCRVSTKLIEDGEDKNGKKKYKPYELKNRQDLFMSWYPSKDINLVSDTEKESDSNVKDDGWSKVFTNEIYLATLSHDLLEWIDNVASEKQRKELLDNLVVVAAMFYPKSKQVNNLTELEEKYINFEGENTTKINKNGTKISVEDDFNYWYGVDYGNKFMKAIQEERKKHDKGTPLNTLYKLIGNTSYGDMVSKYFSIGNVCLGNNITAMTRVAMWCIEKTFNGYQSITDGCIINLDEIPCTTKDRKLNGYNTVTPYRYNAKEKNWTTTKVFFDVELFHSDCETIEQWLKQKVLNTFPKVSCLNYYDIEIKRVGDEIVVHGSGNYAIKNSIKIDDNFRKTRKVEDLYIGDNNTHDTGYCEVLTTDINWDSLTFDENIYKMRSYGKEAYEINWDGFEKDVFTKDDLYDTENFILEEKLNIAKKFLENLSNNPKSVKRFEPIILNRILKIKEVSNRKEYYSTKILSPGDTEYFVRMPLEISLNQFAYKSKKQYLALKKESEDLKIECGQGFEMFFTNNDDDDKTLNYQLAIETIDNAIRDGAMNLQRWLKKIPRNALNPSKDIHPHLHHKQGLEREIDSDYMKD